MVTTTLLLERWNGSAWTILPAPRDQADPCASSSELTAAACTTSRSCVAVGDVAGYADEGASPPQSTLSEIWAGVSWSTRPTLSPGATGTENLFTDVGCASRVACVAVGATDTAAGSLTEEVLLTERWNGGRWTQLAAPQASGTIGSYLRGISCAARLTCIAVGSRSYAYSAQPLIMRYAARR
jgi:hypothetical protein